MPDISQNTDSIILKGGIVVNHDSSFQADVLIQDGIVKNVGLDFTYPETAEIIDVTDQYLFPGGVDLDCHLGVPTPTDPLADTYSTASRAALLGGTTTIINTIHVLGDNPLTTAFDDFIATSADNWACDHAICMQLGSFDAQRGEEMGSLVEKGITLYSARLGSNDSSKLSNYGDFYLDEQEFCSFLKTCRQFGILPILAASTSNVLSNKLIEVLQADYPNIGPELHSHVSPEGAEENTILRASLFALHAGFCCPLLISRIHSQAALKCLTEQRYGGGCLLFGQTTISAIGAPLATSDHLFSNSSDWTQAASYANSPPLRNDKDLSCKLLTHLTSEDIISVGSGHRAITIPVRAAMGLENCAYLPTGVAALGCRLMILWHCGVQGSCGNLDPCTFVRAMSTGPAQLANIYPQKGRIATGSDADIVVWNTTSYRGNYDKLFPPNVPNVFADISCHCGPQLVFLRGQIVVKDQELCENLTNNGVLLCPKPFAYHIYGRVSCIEQCTKSGYEMIKRDPYTGPVINTKTSLDNDNSYKENHFFRKEYYDNVPKVALPPGHRIIHTSVRTAQPPGGSSNSFWMNE